MPFTVIAKIFSQGISFIFHPLLLPTYSFLYLTSLEYYSATQVASSRYALALMLYIFTFLVPGLLVLIMKTLGLIRSIHLHERRERTIPFLVTGIIYYIAYQYFRRFGFPSEYSLILLGATALILLALLINLRWKISIHMMGIGGVAGMLYGMAPLFPHRFFIPIVIIILIAGLLGFARLFLGSHKPVEIYTGFLSGYVFFFGLFASMVR